jgi:putative ABC transport system permease protein
MARPHIAAAARCAGALVSAAASLVPRARRADWLHEWRAEIHHRAAHLERKPQPRRRDAHGLVWRAAGSIPHACWLRIHDWSLSMLWQDLRYAARLLRRSPGFAAVSGVTLALGIGATTAMATIAYAVLMRPLPYRQPDRLVQIWEHNPVKGWTDNIVAPANLLDWRERNRSFTGIAAYYGTNGREAFLSRSVLTGAGEPEMIRGLGVTTNLFEVLGVAPALGRAFTSGDPDDAKIVVLSDGLWRRRFGARRDVVGRSITLDGAPHTVVGVMPPGFFFPDRQAELWSTLGLSPARLRSFRRPHFLRTVARLKEGAALDAARADLTAIASALEREYPDTNTRMYVDAGPYQAWMVSGVQRTLLLFLAAVGGVLLIACANVANLLIARASGRTRELAVRAALGAGRGRLVRQLLVESLLLSVIGAAAGITLTVAALRVFVALGPADLPRIDQIAPDASMLALASAVALMTTLLCGLAPAIHATRRSVEPSLRDSGRGTGGSARGSRTRASLVVVEVALAVALVVGAGLLLRSFAALQSVDPRVDRDRLLTFRVSLPGARYPKGADANAFFARLTERLRATPGVAAVSATSQLPLTGSRWTGDMTIEGRPPTDYGIEIRHKEIAPGYFEAVGLAVLDGRAFEPGDTAETGRVVIVNQALARRYFPRSRAVGQRITFAKPGREAPWRTIVGVVEDEPQDGLGEPVRPEAFESVLQNPQDALSMVVRTSVPAESLAGSVHEIVRNLDPLLVAFEVRTMDSLISQSLDSARFSTLLVTVCGSVALLLAMVGVYGIVSCAVAHKKPEFGLRMALGANRRDVLALVVRRELGPVVAGLVLGLVLAVGVSRMLTTYLFGIGPFDLPVFAGVTGLLAATAAGAALLPAIRATRVDPLSVLRSE